MPRGIQYRQVQIFISRGSLRHEMILLFKGCEIEG